MQLPFYQPRCPGISRSIRIVWPISDLSSSCLVSSLCVADVRLAYEFLMVVVVRNFYLSAHVCMSIREVGSNSGASTSGFFPVPSQTELHQTLGHMSLPPGINAAAAAAAAARGLTIHELDIHDPSASTGPYHDEKKAKLEGGGAGNTSMIFAAASSSSAGAAGNAADQAGAAAAAADTFVSPDEQQQHAGNSAAAPWHSAHQSHHHHHQQAYSGSQYPAAYFTQVIIPSLPLLKFYCVAPMTCILRQNSHVDLSNCHFHNLLHPLHSLYIQLSRRKLRASLCPVRSAGYNV